MSSGTFKNVTYKLFVYKWDIFNLDVCIGFGKGWYAIKLNQPTINAKAILLRNSSGTQRWMSKEVNILIRISYHGNSIRVS